MIEPARRAGLDPLASTVASVVAEGAAAGCRAVDLRVLPDRGLGIGRAWFHGLPVAWSPALAECAPLALEIRSTA